MLYTCAVELLVMENRTWAYANVVTDSSNQVFLLNKPFLSQEKAMAPKHL